VKALDIIDDEHGHGGDHSHDGGHGHPMEKMGGMEDRMTWEDVDEQLDEWL